MVEHCYSKLAHKRFCLNMKIPQHGVATPSTQHSNGNVIDLSAYEGHGAAGAQGAGADARVS
jgi:hypothetical protein